MTDTPKSMNDLANYIHSISVAKGFYEPDLVRDFDGMLANIHGEVSEALFEWRNGKGFNETYYAEDSHKPEGIPIELADIIIRVLDICAYYKIDIEQAIWNKVSYNSTRPHRHGNKRS